MTQKSFKLFANCIPVKGIKRCLIADLQRKDFYFIPEGLYEILTLHKDKSIEELHTIYDNKLNKTINDLLHILEKHELGFWCDNPTNFPELSLQWKAPSLITNAIIEVKDCSVNFNHIFDQLNELGCKFIELRFQRIFNISDIRKITDLTKKYIFRNINIFLPFSLELSKLDFQIFLNEYPRLGRLIIYNASNNKSINTTSDAQVIFLTQDLSLNIHCGQIHPNYFVINIPTFTESQHHNTCLNRKISIDQNGNIKNCPSMVESYGNIKDTTLKEALNHPDFKKYWNIKKDQISVCQDCEFRHICTDCRAYVENPEDIYSKPL
ncbi:MAG: grasp-with-spasm system SPASM domain peptide maturase, partial [Saprospiraceae bacterium]